MSLYFLFLKEKIASPIASALFALLISRNLSLSILTLLISLLILWVIERFINDPNKKKLYFYFNFGKTELKLYSFVFLISFFLLGISNFLLNEFI